MKAQRGRAGRWCGWMVALACACVASAATAPPCSAPDACRLRGYRTDRGTGQRWAVFEDVVHPGAPWRVVPVEGISAGSALQAQPVRPAIVPAAALSPLEVRAGSEVLLWRSSETVRLSLAATALESGRRGARIALRLDGSGARVAGVVRGPGSVELAPALAGSGRSEP